jgi:vancomycin resistance protein YoaR
VDESASEGARDRKVFLWLIVGLFALVSLAYGAAVAATGDQLPRGTAIAGVDVGGLSPVEAKAALEDAFRAATDKPVTVSAEWQREAIDPASIGLVVDFSASVDQIPGGGWTPTDLWAYFVGGEEHDLVVTADTAALAGAIAAFADQVDDPAVDGGVTFRGTRVVTSPSAGGTGIDREAAAGLVLDAFPATDEVVELPVVDLEPDITDAEVAAAVSSLANPALSDEVTIVVGERNVVLAPRDFSRALSLVAEDGALALKADADVLTKMITSRLKHLRLAPVDATVKIVQGHPKVIGGKSGITFEPDDLTYGFPDAAVSSTRRLEVSTQVTAPEFTAADARDLKIVEEVSEFTTHFPYAEYRNINIGRAAELINGTVLKPNEVFSLNETVGERTKENGFTVGFIIDGGVFREDYGGGVSQSATTTFNAAFFAGLEDIEHKPHSLFIDRYPVGREATVAWPSVDLRFRNDTPYGILIQAWVVPGTGYSQGSMTVRMWSTKVWDIKAGESARYNYTDPGTRYIEGDGCVANTGYQGFDIDVYRYFYKHGSTKLVRKQTFHTHYIAADTVICGSPPKN